MGDVTPIYMIIGHDNANLVKNREKWEREEWVINTWKYQATAAHPHEVFLKKKKKDSSFLHCIMIQIDPCQLGMRKLGQMS